MMTRFVPLKLRMMVILIFEKGMEQMLQQVFNSNCKDDALVLFLTAKLSKDSFIHLLSL